MTTERTITAEYKRAGHPDRVADQIALEAGAALLELDPDARFDIQAVIHHGPGLQLDPHLDYFPESLVVLLGQLNTILPTKETHQKFDEVVQAFNKKSIHLNPTSCKLWTWQSFNQQSPDIIKGLGRNGHKGAGDATIVHAYASGQTHNGLGAAHALAYALVGLLDAAFASHAINGLLSDGKVQVDLVYEKDGKFVSQPKRASSIIVAAQHYPDTNPKHFKRDIVELVRSSFIGQLTRLIDDQTQITVNGTGIFSKGGPEADTGVSGRIETLYASGGVRPHGGGLAVGRDGTKTDLSCLLAARYIALHLINGHLAEEAEVSISYAIGATKPTNVSVNAHGSKYSDAQLRKAVVDSFDLSPAAIGEFLQLKPADYRAIASHGFFGHPHHRWEQSEPAKIDILRQSLSRQVIVGGGAKKADGNGAGTNELGRIKLPAGGLPGLPR